MNTHYDVIILIAISFSHTHPLFEVDKKFVEMEVTNVARAFIEKRPNTSLFLGLLVLSSCVPVAIFLAIVLGFFLVMVTIVLVVQGTIIGVGLTTLLVILPGPLCFATFCTFLAYVAQCVFARLKPVCKAKLGCLIDQVKRASVGLPTCPAENVMAFMNSGNMDDLNMNESASIITDD